MTVKYKGAVQKIRAQYVEVDFGDLPSGTFEGLIALPPGALIIGGEALVLTASDAVTSEVVAIGTAANNTAYGSVADSTAAGRTALTLPATLTAARTVVGLKRTAVGAVTEGTYGLYVEYAIAGGSDATQD
jgi:hypothetical protein